MIEIEVEDKFSYFVLLFKGFFSLTLNHAHRIFLRAVRCMDESVFSMEAINKCMNKNLLSLNVI